MKLFLASEAKHPESLKKLKKFVGDSFKNQRIAYIPTAANGEGYGAWKGGESVKVVKSLGANLTIVELEASNFADIYTPLKQASIIWFAGGQTGYLLYWLRRVKLDKLLPKLLKDGKIYVGSSAGSMPASKPQFVSEWHLGEPEPGASLLPGLGLVDFEIYPHYEEKLLPRIKKRWKKGKLYLLKDGEAITVIDGTVAVLGKQQVLKK